MAKIYFVYAAIPGKERVFFNGYYRKSRMEEDVRCLKAIGLKVDVEIREE